MTTASKVNGLSPVSDGGEEAIAMTRPYRVSVTIEGEAAILFHAWNVESVAGKAAAAKGSKAKKTDDVESYVYRNVGKEICIPGEYLRGSIIGAARFMQDPRSPRKSAMDLFKAGIVSLTELASLGATTWEYLDQRRVTVQRNGVTRMRPAFGPGWKAVFILQVQLAEYIQPPMLLKVIQEAGRLIGVGDFRPSYGRFQVVHFEVLEG